jgi:hypothetical protein
VVLKHCGLKLKMLSPAPRLKKTAHWLKGGEGVKLKLLLKGTHKSTRCASGQLKQKNELFEELNRLSQSVQGNVSPCDMGLIIDRRRGLLVGAQGILSVPHSNCYYVAGG